MELIKPGRVYFIVTNPSGYAQKLTVQGNRDLEAKINFLFFQSLPPAGGKIALYAPPAVINWVRCYYSELFTGRGARQLAIFEN